MSRSGNHSRLKSKVPVSPVQSNNAKSVGAVLVISQGSATILNMRVRCAASMKVTHPFLSTSFDSELHAPNLSGRSCPLTPGSRCYDIAMAQRKSLMLVIGVVIAAIAVGLHLNYAQK